MSRLNNEKSWDFHRVNVHLSELNKLHRLAQEAVGFDYFSFTHKLPLPASAPIVYTFNNFPEEFNRVYDEKQCWRIDPVFNYLNREDFTIWSLSLDKKNPVAKLLEDNQEIKDGVTYRFPQCNGSIASISFAGPQSVTKMYAQSIFFKVYNVYKAALNVLLEKRRVTYNVCGRLLTAPELRILRLSADGMTAEQIAVHIFLTQSTVQFHIKNIVSKLCCKNKAQAIAKAALMSIL
ncbi:hypothetical protein AWM79_21785 [Pseudomonas agarici]|uniref:Uncharacterized protein n=1 Tax=Pseudomonas agarici TaxID=46677 RepID=A0A0X1T6Q8_PSEAA|nr:LuxR family transcriptional regulator [Pseudomonas agarici]AMB87768.1 hypothetical protein AWM79_21785 [Pseudomonas agarici]NWB93050.1 LuxR family transcriptional regulator [Pseudomonas agarici]NWC10103.1 LuxR family transcriptional regulator [Pseudomonas agarici]SEL71764.1 regulatory protein, luxR family [Pseudomonas agarici]